MTLAAGTRLGAYDILALIGAGGMGEVYRARDSRLHRDVALKVLPDLWANDPDRLSRFQREAQVLASLNHPGIAAIYGLEEAASPGSGQARVRALVLELVEGPTLADRIGQGPIPLDEAIPIARQIAQALEAAHEQGVIHRDLKPANIKLRPDGTVKVLDFGLAKLADPVGAGLQTGNSAFSQSPTITSPAATGIGVILGTAAYMAPEQARGKPVDKRTDIWAFGCVLYEMLTGTRAFEGEDVTDTLAAIVRGEPDWTRFPPDVPPHIRAIVKGCLQKDRNARIPDISVARYLMDQAIGPPMAATAAIPAATRRSPIVWKTATALLVLTTAAGFAIAYAGRATTPAVVRFLIAPSEKGAFMTGGRAGASAAISPNGRTLAFTAKDATGKTLLWVRPIDSLTAQPLAGTDDASFPFWSPDSRFIAYFTQDKLLKIAAGGGPPQTVCVALGGRGGAWSRDGVIVFGSITGALSRVSSAGGQPVAVTRLVAGQQDHRFPSFLPDARHLLFYVNGSSGPESLGVYLTSLDSGESKQLLIADSSGIYASGYLLFARKGALLAQSFNAKTFELAGDPFPVAERVESSVFGGVPAFSASDNGVLAYGIALASRVAGVQLVWLDRQGKQIETVGLPGNYRGLDLAPDGRRVGIHRHEGQGGDIWLLDGPRGTTSRLTFDASQENSSPIWSPDGNRIAFGSRRSGKYGLYQKASDGTGNDELLIQSDFVLAPMSWAPDGHSIVYSNTKGGPSDLWVIALSGDRKALPLLNTQFFENRGQISSDGKWLAYDSDETGRPEVYVRPFPTGAGKWQVSTSGGRFPRWRRDGLELFYINLEARPKLMAAEVHPRGPAFERGTTKELFDSEINDLGGHPSYYSFAVSADGQRFLIARNASSAADDSGSVPIAVVVNWNAGLKK